MYSLLQALENTLDQSGEISNFEQLLKSNKSYEDIVVEIKDNIDVESEKNIELYEEYFKELLVRGDVSEEKMIEAIRFEPRLIRYILTNSKNIPSESVMLEAVKSSGKLIEFILEKEKNVSPKILLESIKNDESAFEIIKEKDIIYVEFLKDFLDGKIDEKEYYNRANNINSHIASIFSKKY
jgi:hypothetical protein